MFNRSPHLAQLIDFPLNVLERPVIHESEESKIKVENVAQVLGIRNLRHVNSFLAFSHHHSDGSEDLFVLSFLELCNNRSKLFSFLLRQWWRLCGMFEGISRFVR